MVKYFDTPQLLGWYCVGKDGEAYGDGSRKMAEEIASNRAYMICINSTGDELAGYSTYEEALARVREMEEEDLDNAEYERGYYDIYNSQTEEYERVL